MNASHVYREAYRLQRELNALLYQQFASPYMGTLWRACEVALENVERQLIELHRKARAAGLARAYKGGKVALRVREDSRVNYASVPVHKRTLHQRISGRSPRYYGVRAGVKRQGVAA